MSSNGLLNAQYNRASERGFIVLDNHYRIVVSSHAAHTHELAMALRLRGKRITLSDSDSH